MKNTSPPAPPGYGGQAYKMKTHRKKGAFFRRRHLERVEGVSHT